jgi:hypothetical protein
MTSNKILKKIRRYMTYALTDGTEKVGFTKDTDGFVQVDEIINKGHCKPTFENIKDCVKYYNQNFELIEKDGFSYIKYNKLETIYEENSNSKENSNCKMIIKKSNVIVNNNDILTLSPVYILTVSNDKLDDILNNHNIDDPITLYSGTHKNIDEYVHIYFEWAHAYLHGVKFIKNPDKTLETEASNLHILLKYIYMIVSNDGHPLSVSNPAD